MIITLDFFSTSCHDDAMHDDGDDARCASANKISRKFLTLIYEISRLRRGKDCPSLRILPLRNYPFGPTVLC